MGISYVSYLLLVLFFGLIFAFLPRYIHVLVKKLLIYHKYEKDEIKTRFTKIIGVYVLLGVALGIVFFFLFSNIMIKEANITRAIVSFLMSFSLVIILRITTLLSKSNLIAKILSENQRRKLLANSENYDYKSLKQETESFLFSIFLSAILSLMVYFFYKLLFHPEEIINIPIKISYLGLMNYLIFILIFVVVLVVVTLVGECLLKYGKVHQKCIEDFKEN